MLSSLPPILKLVCVLSGNVRISLLQLSPDDQLAAITNGTIDAGFVNLTGQTEPVVLNDTALRIDCAWAEQLVAMIPKGYGIATTRALALHKLSAKPFVVLQRSHFSGFYDKAIALCHEAGFSPRIEQYVQTLPEAIALVAAGLGVSFAPRRSAQLWASQVDFVPIAGRPTTEVSIVTRDRDDNVLVQVLRQSAIERRR
jgi:DNA-binding transcriptional LysR family regulator